MKKILKYRKTLAVLVIFLAIGLTYKCTTSKNNNRVVNTMIAKKSSVDLSYNLNATVESQKTVAVFSSNIGEVEEVLYRLNDSVKKGETLVLLKTDGTDNSELNIEKAKLNISNLKNNYDNLQKLYKVGGVSKYELDNAKLTLDTAIIDLKTLQSAYKPFKREIKSPISGVIVEANVDANYKIDSTRPLYKIADIENLIITAEVSNSKARKLKEGQQVLLKSISLDEEEILEGKIKTISKISVQSKKSNEMITKISIELNNYSTLKPGDSADITIIYNKIDNKIILPFQYIEFENNMTYVYVLKDNIVMKKEVKLGKNKDNINYEIIEGISENEVLLDNTAKVYKEGDKLK